MPKKKASSLAKSTPASMRGHKRQISSSATPKDAATSTPGTRTSKRIKASEETTPTNKSTPTKSKYFEPPDSDEDDEEEIDEASESGYEDQDEDEDEDVSAGEPSEPPTETDDYDSEEEAAAKKKRKQNRSRPGKVSEADSTNETVDRKDLWREGVKTGLGPGKKVFIQKPKPRGDGGVKYESGKIHPNTMEFLKDLKRNNDRDWLKAHDPDYRQSWKDWESMVESLTEKIGEIDDTIPELPPKDVVFRIYRDIRFSSDKTPYKPHFSAAWSRTGRKGPYACYYVQIQPGNRSFVGSGLWHPEAAPVALIRTEIDRNPRRIRSLLTEAGVRKHIFGGIAKDEKKAVKAFCTQNAEGALKTKPKVSEHF